ncbi:hypothetical protein JOM56_004633, partial [Amanita muscaria]
MKLTTAAVLAFTCASALANSVPYGETAVYARDLYERGSGEGALGPFEKRRGHRGPSLSKPIANIAGIFGGGAVKFAIQQQMTPQTPPQQQRRSLQTRVRRRRVPNFAGSWGPMRKQAAKGIAASFLDGFGQGIAGRGLEEDVLDEL